MATHKSPEGIPQNIDYSFKNPPKFKRNYRACLNCRVRKVKCDLGSVDNPRDGKCARCLRERKDCVFVESKRGGPSNVIDGKRKKLEDDSTEIPLATTQIRSIDLQQNEIANSNQSHLNNQFPIRQQVPIIPVTSAKAFNRVDGAVPKTSFKGPSNHFSTMEGALVFLANAAGTVAEADERDNIDAMKKHEQIEAQIKSKTSSRTSLHNSGPHSVTTSCANSPSDNTPQNESSNSLPDYNSTRRSIPPAENGYAVRPKGSSSLSNIDYIGGANSILNEDEAERLINLFFTTMHPYFPYLPKFLHSPNVLSGYPILLCAILTIASRYYHFENNDGGGVPRNIEVHDRLWLYLQRLISQTVWAEASTRSIGTIFAFLLFTEWNPRAIHWRWSDYANKADDSQDANSNDSSNGSQDEANLAGLGAMRRSYRMGWMLIGSSVRLAQDMGFMEISPKTFLATHVAEINSVMDISRRSMLAYSLSEVDLDTDDAAEESSDQNEDQDSKLAQLSENDLKLVSENMNLKFTQSQKAQIELLQIMLLGHESVYGYKAQLGGLSQRQNLSVLNIISPLINNWGRKYKHLLELPNTKPFRNNSLLQVDLINPNSKPAKDLEEIIKREAFIFEFNYVKLYIYSLALSPTSQINNDGQKKNPKFSLKLDEISKSAKYIGYAFEAANELLSVAHRVHKVKMLRYMPVRWLKRIVRAVAFIVKCYLTITAHKNASGSNSVTIDSTILSLSLISVDDIIQSIQKAAITLRDCSPDELHLCTRYSNVLLYLCSDMKSNSKAQSNEDESKRLFKRPKFNKDLADEEINDKNLDSPNEDYSNSGQAEGKNTLPPFNFNYNTHTFDKNPNVMIGASKDSTNDSQFESLSGDTELMDWFIGNKDIGLDFVGPWTEMIEQQLNSNDQYNFGENPL